jgi:cytochrome c biogenesis protein ResB
MATAPVVMAAAKTRPAGSGRLWALLSNVKLGIVLLALVTAAAIAGTLIESAHDTATAQRLVYHSLWFCVLMIALAVNLAVATWRSASITLRLPWTRPLRRRPERFRELPDVRELSGPLSTEQVSDALERHVGRVTGDGPALFAQRGIIQRWGVIVTHIGMLLLLGGGVYLSVMAHFEGPPATAQIWVGEGMTRSWYLAPNPGNPARMRRVEMPFQLRLHDFDADYFPNTQVPEAFTSTVELITPDGQRSMHRVNMNEALRWRGWKFSQASFSMLDDNLEPSQGRFLSSLDGQDFMRLFDRGRLAVELTDTRTQHHYPVFDAGVGTCVSVPQSDLFFEMTDDQRFALYRGAEPLGQGEVNGAAPTAGLTARIVGRLPAAYTGLTVMREPQGLKLFFYLSFLLFLGGPFLAFTASHRQVWAWVDSKSRRALIGGRARGRREALTGLLNRIEADLRGSQS